MTLRRHQAELRQEVDAQIADKNTSHTFYAIVTPGGGKSALPLIMGRLIHAGLASAICWVVPRQNLQDQAVRGFMDPYMRKLTGTNLTVRTSTNDQNPCRSLHGFVTTYQAIGQDRLGILADEIQRRRYILVLDEWHHVQAGGVWDCALQPIVNAAKYRLLMTGTLERGDEGRIAYLPYKKKPYGDFMADPSLQPNATVIRYPRSAALREQAILPLQFHFLDGHAEWEDEGGKRTRVDSLAAKEGEEAAKAVYTALSTEYANQLLDMALEHWHETRRHNPRSKMLVVTADYQNAKRITAYLERYKLTAAIATSHNPKQAERAIMQFKRGQVDILVTIAMCYEGLDVPAATHIACLTHIRSTPWIEQMVARVVRIDREAGPYQAQRGHVFAPNDKAMREIVAQIKSEQQAYARRLVARPQELFSLNGEQMPGATKKEHRPYNIKPLASGVTGAEGYHLGGDEATQPGSYEAGTALLTPDESEQDLRQVIKRHINRFCAENGISPKTANRQVIEYTGKARDLMTIEELRSTLEWVRKTYPMDRRVRVNTKARPWP